MTKVVIANKYVDANGRTYKGGDVAEVSAGEAADLIYKGAARPHVEVKAVAVDTKGGK